MGMHKLYESLAAWWPLLSPPEDHAEEVAFFLPLVAEVTAQGSASLLDLGSGGGNNALHMKAAFKSVMLVDLAAEMLAVSRELNPDCKHQQGDMRTVRLGRTFDVVFVHDAIDYMTTLPDLRHALETAFIHCVPGGMAVFVPDHVRETFEPSTDHGGADGDDRALRYLEWSYDPDANDSTIVTDYVVVYREGDDLAQMELDRHVTGLFGRDEWLSLLHEVGFQQINFVIDPFHRHVFVARKANEPSTA
jgi:SAM-dependent methyltransferase